MKPDPTLKAGPPRRVYKFEDMEVVWRIDGSVLYKSDRMRRYMIVRNRVGENEIPLEVIHLMFYEAHNKRYPLEGHVKCNGGPDLDFHWDTKQKKFEVEIAEAS